MASAHWRIRSLIASAFAASAAACVTPAARSEAEAWSQVRQAYAGRLAEDAALPGAASGHAADSLSEQARERDDWAWESARRRDDASEYERYLREHRAGAHRLEAQRRLDQLRAGDEADWGRADLRDSIEAYQSYIANHPDGVYRDRASQRIRALRDRQLMRPLHAPRPTGMEAQPQRLPALPPGQPPPASQTPSDRLRAAPSAQPTIAAPAAGLSTGPARAPHTSALPSPAAPARAAPPRATRPFARPEPAEPEADARSDAEPR